jgi:alanine racemase
MIEVLKEIPEGFYPRCWIEVNLDNIEKNYHKLKAIIPNKVKMMAVIKGNAYGHGIIPVAAFLESIGISYFGVSLPEEAIKLREHGIRVPILILSPTSKYTLKEVMKLSITSSIGSFEEFANFEKLAEDFDVKPKFHLEVDTGMGRYGIDSSTAIDLIIRAAESKCTELEGLYTHFASANDSKSGLFKKQLDKFKKLVTEISERDVRIPLIHCCNSAATFRDKEAHFDMVRIGTALYGQKFDNEASQDLISAWQFKTRINQIKLMKNGSNIGYGDDVILKSDRRVAVIPVGYADGIMVQSMQRAYKAFDAIKLSSKELAKYFGLSRTQETVLVNGKKAAIISRIGMQHIVFDISSHPELKVDDQVRVRARTAGVDSNIVRMYKRNDNWYIFVENGN